jgi:hypothetical protein
MVQKNFFTLFIFILFIIFVSSLSANSKQLSKTPFIPDDVIS